MACSACTTGSVHAGNPLGKEVTLGPLQSYVTGNEHSKRIIVFGTDVFGWRLPNTRILADEFAARDFWVVVPDLFGGRDLPRWTLTATEHRDKTTWKQWFLMPPLLIFYFIPFLFRNTNASQVDKITTLVSHLRETYPDAKIGLAGYCWGGRYALTLNHLFDATFAAHPSRVKFPAELDGITKPISFVVAETDKQYNAERAEATEALLRGKGFNDFEIVVFKGVHHGWTVRTDMANPDKRAKRDQARDQALNWFEKHLIL